MRGKNAISGSGLFLIELLFGLMIFALTAAVCLQIFVGSHQISSESSNLNRAVVRAQSAAECFKATHGDLEETARLLNGHFSKDQNAAFQYFDSDWNVVHEFSPDSGGTMANAGYTLGIGRFSEQDGYIDGGVVVRDNSGNLIFSIPVTVLEVTP